METNTTPSRDSATSANGALVAAIAACAAPATPENTPIPGGGRWCWSYTLPGWVAVTEPAAAAPTLVQQPNPSTFEPTQE